ncbi:hypothetical protein Q8W16_23220, partial [Photobacterium damselae subsp. piscicida]|nr:hypothetical protein [Photobacterium damselae subsp. piscicida]
EIRPDPLSFSNFQENEFPPDSKYPFESFTNIPEDTSGLSYPEYDNLTFTLPTVYNYLPFEIVEVKGLTLLSHLGKDAFCIDPRRWHRVKQYISNGIVEYP